MTNPATMPFRLRSFVRRNRRQTPKELQTFETLWPKVGLTLEMGRINYDAIFGREAKRFLEIGFGFGQSLLALAKLRPEIDLIGVETHQPGIDAVLKNIASDVINNIRLYASDVIDVLEKGITENSLDGIQIFFPDPWPKRRHHARRLIQSATIENMVNRLKPGASLHLATDWSDYARHMLQVLTKEERLENNAGKGQFSERSIYRPIITKFEKRALQEGRTIWELQFRKK